MSHFIVAAILRVVPGDTEDARQRIGVLLDKYDENKDVPHYEVMSETDLERMREYYEEKDGRPLTLDDLCGHLDDWMNAEGAPVVLPDGTETIEYLSRYNPDSKWDWWDIGGRWNGWATGHEEGSEDGFNFDAKFRKLGGNWSTVIDLIDAIKSGKTYSPFAIVTPEGEWIEKGKMGWWACTKDEKEQAEWDTECLRILEKYTGCIVVGIDCHI